MPNGPTTPLGRQAAASIVLLAAGLALPVRVKVWVAAL